MNRENTRKINFSSIQIGHQNKVLIQSMCNIKTENYLEVSKQINECAKMGADLMRVSIMDEKDASAIKKIKELTNIPIVGDIHFDYRLALLAIENGIDKIRINPGNIGSIENIKKVVDASKSKNIPIRIGVNSGSIDKEIFDYSTKYSGKLLVESAKKHVKILEDLGFYNIVISLKGLFSVGNVIITLLLSNNNPFINIIYLLISVQKLNSLGNVTEIILLSGNFV